jgi:VIT1/CCC1 family predicted Fe2+/Mn2+ transporter
VVSLTSQHIERHFRGSAAVRDVVIGMSDGLTVPFALAAGLSGAVASSGIVVTAGLAEIAAGSIAMGLGGYLAAQSEAEHYASERAREEREVRDIPEIEQREVEQILRSYGLAQRPAETIARALSRRPKRWVDFMMRFELGLETPDPRRGTRSALTIGASYAIGGIVPLVPYMVLARATSALTVSVLFTLAALLIFGYVKGRFTGGRAIRSALQSVLIGGAAAAAAFALARAIS